MTQQQKEDIFDKVKVFAFPILLLVVSFFLSSLNSKFEKMHDTLLEVRIEQERVKQEIFYLRVDTSKLQDDMEEVKKNTK